MNLSAEIDQIFIEHRFYAVTDVYEAGAGVYKYSETYVGLDGNAPMTQVRHLLIIMLSMKIAIPSKKTGVAMLIASGVNKTHSYFI